MNVSIAMGGGDHSHRQMDSLQRRQYYWAKVRIRDRPGKTRKFDDKLLKAAKAASRKE